MIPILGARSSPRRSGRKSLADALLTKTQQRVLGVLFGQPGRSFYASELIRNAGTGSGAAQRELAKLVGTSASVICRLEDADYEGHSLAMLNRIAAALHRRVEIRFVLLRGAKHLGAHEATPV